MNNPNTRQDVELRTALAAFMSNLETAKEADLKSAWEISRDLQDIDAHRKISAECARRSQATNSDGISRRAKPAI